MIINFLIIIQGRMKKVSLKIKLTLLYTIFILVVVGTVLGILFSLSGREILASTKMSLERRVEESLEEIEMQDGELKIDSDFYSVENGVYLSMYDSTGYFLYGKIPGGFDRQPDFLDGEVREIKDFIEKYRLNVKESIFNTQEFSVKLIQVPKILSISGQ